jgi:hypothetical protein
MNILYTSYLLSTNLFEDKSINKIELFNEIMINIISVMLITFTEFID